MPRRALYVPRGGPRAAESTRRRIVDAVRALLEEGTFHESTVEEIAERAGVARATLYQHFGSRLGLVDAMCERFAENPALRALRGTDRLEEFVALAVEFWAREERVLAPLYGVAAVDPAARSLVERQRRDRHGEIRRLVQRLSAAGALADGVDERSALSLLAALTSFETYVELCRNVGLGRAETVRALQASAVRLLAAG